MSARAKILAVVPARGGSKRVPGKNIHPLNGKPLLAYTLEAAQGAAAVSEFPIVVSTDSPKVTELAKSLKAQVSLRPEVLASDASSTESVLLHVIDEFAAQGRTFDWVMTLPPTSPFRSSASILKFIAAIDSCANDIDCIMSLSENRGYFWRKGPGGELSPLFANASRRQQEREPLYEENSAIYLTRISALKSTGKIFGNKIHGIVIDSFEAVDINTADDFVSAEAMILAREKLQKLPR